MGLFIYIHLQMNPPIGKQQGLHLDVNDLLQELALGQVPHSSYPGCCVEGKVIIFV